jgi:hypothetical protein
LVFAMLVFMDASLAAMRRGPAHEWVDVGIGLVSDK